MNTQKMGKLIAELRKNAGYTQASLAEALLVTDKAVSKWERGLCAPDSSLLTKLSMLLDVDIEFLISERKSHETSQWVGEIKSNDIEGRIAGKPILHYLLSYFMLVGITDVYIQTTKKDYVRNLHLEKYGLNISFFPFSNRKTIVIHDNFLLFGANLTRYFQGFMQNENNIIPVVDGKELPMFFTCHASFSPEWHREHGVKKCLTRGMVFLPLNEDAEAFIQIYERNSGQKIADLREIAERRGLLPNGK